MSPQTWLLREGWKRGGGSISVYERPGPGGRLISIDEKPDPR